MSARAWKGRTLLPWVLALIAVACALAFTGYVKDDAYISFRYARNLALGQGLVFNPGERVEGYTNLLWVLLAVPPHWLGVSPLWTARALGLLGSVGLALAAWALARRLAGPAGQTQAGTWGAAAAGATLATHPTAAVYAMSGLETTAFAALAAWAVERACAGRPRAAFALGALAALTRPEGHVVVAYVPALLAIAGVPLARVLRPALATLGTLATYHGLRLAWFGAVAPNTFRVKSGNGDFLSLGVESLIDAVGLGGGQALLLLTGLALLLFRRSVRLWAVGGLGLFFLAYLVWVGRDAMALGRLVLVSWPLLAGVAGAGLVRLGDGLPPRARRRAPPVLAVLALLALLPGLVDVVALQPAYAGVHAAMQQAGGQMGRDLDAFVPAGEWVVHQDMGIAPYEAPDLRFFDTYGLVSREVADVLVDEGVCAIAIRPGRDRPYAEIRTRYRARIRDLAFGHDPAALVLVASLGRLPEPVRAEIERVAAERGPLAAYGSFTSSHAVGLLQDRRLTERYDFVRVYDRSPTYKLLLFLRYDLLQRWWSGPGRPRP